MRPTFVSAGAGPAVPRAGTRPRRPRRCRSPRRSSCTCRGRWRSRARGPSPTAPAANMCDRTGPRACRCPAGSAAACRACRRRECDRHGLEGLHVAGRLEQRDRPQGEEHGDHPGHDREHALRSRNRLGSSSYPAIRNRNPSPRFAKRLDRPAVGDVERLGADQDAAEDQHHDLPDRPGNTATRIGVRRPPRRPRAEKQGVDTPAGTITFGSARLHYKDPVAVTVDEEKSMAIERGKGRKEIRQERNQPRSHRRKKLKEDDQESRKKRTAKKATKKAAHRRTLHSQSR